VLHAKKMTKVFTILTLLLIFQNSFGQSNFELKGQLIDCSDSSKLILGFIHLIQNDSILSTAYTDDNGDFKFKDLKNGAYQIQTDYFYYPNTTLEISIPTNNKVTICLSEKNSDSLLASINLRPIYTRYYYGLPKYSDKYLNEVGKEYGVKWQNLGCVSDDNFDKYNEMIDKILTFRNGEGWRDKFWSEVEQKYD
jgi:hypothetical protein|tara:strand:+ start:3554 stop:4138 length:585 start_codon:yes stop_codon:yes gene_type:complete